MKPTVETRLPWYRSTLAIALVGSLLLWAALPPLAIGWLAWIAPVPWLLLVRTREVPGRRPYRALWLASLVFWMGAIHWLRLPHPALYLGWLALSAYLAIYLPVFVGVSRVAVQRVGVPLWLAAPIVWTGLELARAHLLTGFLMASIAHTQVRFTGLIQVSDLAGEFAVDFLVMLVAACIATALPLAYMEFPPGDPRSPRPRLNWRPLALLPGVTALAAALVYGHWRMADATRALQRADSQPPGPRIALIQGNSLAEWKQDPSREQNIMEEYVARSEQAVLVAKQRGDGRAIDLIVWPETMFRTGLVTFDPGYRFPSSVASTPDEISSYGPHDLARLVQRLGAPILVGIDRAHISATTAEKEPGNPSARRYNSAVLVNCDGKIAGTYDKVHRVMFGEYIPFADWLPSLYSLTPLTGGIEAGAGPVILESGGIHYAPSICYETTIPHVIRRQAATRANGVPADVLINVTNDAWYWGSSELDMHLACAVFRAIETRKPLLIAANGGISAWIDRYGRLRAQSPKQQPDIILADLKLQSKHSWYVQLGDWFAGTCLACCGVFAAAGWRGRPRRLRHIDKRTTE